MSQRKDDHVWSCKKAEVLEQKVGEKVSEILRQQYAGRASPMKNISLETGISPDTVRKWYSGRKPPHLGHFLILAQNYPAVLKMLLEAVGHDYLIPHILLQRQGSEVAEQPDKNVPINVPLKTSTPILNKRQLWFLKGIRGNLKLTARDIAVHWRPITLKTAKRDIAELKDLGIIRFSGAKKSGRYEMIGLSSDVKG